MRFAKEKRHGRRAKVRVPRRPVGELIAWLKELLRMWGKISDREIVRRAGVALATVLYARRRRGIAACHPHRRPVEWTPERIARLGSDSDGKVAGALDVPRELVKKKRQLLGIPAFFPPPHASPGGVRWTPEEIALLGTMSDGNVAAELGRSVARVSQERREVKIRALAGPRRTIRWRKGMLRPLGRRPDAEVARRRSVRPGR